MYSTNSYKNNYTLMFKHTNDVICANYLITSILYNQLHRYLGKKVYFFIVILHILQIASPPPHIVKL